MKYTRFEELPVWQAAIDLAVEIYRFTGNEEFKGQGSLRDQIERATVSISNNVAEGFERGSTNELLAFLYIARGSAGEVRPMLKVLDEWSDFNNLKSQISDLISKSENISRQLYGLIETLKNSGILGQRHLDNKERAKYSSKQSREDFLAEIDRTPH